MTASVHEFLTFATLALTVAWLLRHFLSRPVGCDGCGVTVPTPARLGIRRKALKVITTPRPRPW